jgi:hypothetical protein
VPFLEKILSKIFIQDLAYGRDVPTIGEILGSLVAQAPQDDMFTVIFVFYPQKDCYFPVTPRIFPRFLYRNVVFLLFLFGED